jgi:hypothetical protein
MRADVVLVPVSVGLPPGADGSEPSKSDIPALLGLADANGEWLRAEVTADPDEALASLLARLPDGFCDILDFNRTVPNPVSFVDETRSGSPVSLIYSVALPAAVADIADRAALSDFTWQPLLAPRRKFEDAIAEGPAMVSGAPYAHLVLDFWRQSLEETTDVLAFLPQYFTLRQLREMYNAVWGYEQDFNAFKAWALKKKTLGEYIEDVGTKVPNFGDGNAFQLTDGKVDVEAEDDRVAARIRQRLEIAHAAAVFTSGKKGVSIATVAAAALPVMSGAGAGLILGYVTGAAIHGYARTQSAAGAKPTWYMRKSERPVVGDKLNIVYSPRPAWLPRDSNVSVGKKKKKSK